MCHLGALFDAAYFALAPGSGPGRFRYGAAHWLGPGAPGPASARSSARPCAAASCCDRVWPYPAADTAPLAARGQPAPRRRSPPASSAVLALADGVRTAADIARTLGRPAFHTLVDVRRLAAAGLVEHPAAPARHSRPAPARGRAGVLGSPASPRYAAAAIALEASPTSRCRSRLRDALEAL